MVHGHASRKSPAVGRPSGYRRPAGFREDMLHPDLAAEQAYLDQAHDHLAVMQATATGLADRFRVGAAEDFNDAAVEHAMRRYRAALDVGGSLCFGRIDEDGGARWYIGRRHVEDDRGDAVV